ncbi:hypothetical protein [Rhizobium leguminosarum]|uniref:hypothetical protein n=1 Tax=Rhizobium TaxID=379 RepID=UPI001FDEB1AF|nr:hypothetical protein [Rhizobium leguminosarum]
MVIRLFYTQLDVSYQEEGSRAVQIVQGGQDQKGRRRESFSNVINIMDVLKKSVEADMKDRESGLIKSAGSRPVPL